MVWNSSWGPTPVGPFTAYLYWDVNLATGALTRGFTHLVPAFGVTQPASPGKDQHWFDTNTNIMKVWDGAHWTPKGRVFAGSFAGGGNVINEYALGSQVGIIYPGSMDTWPDITGTSSSVQIRRASELRTVRSSRLLSRFTLTTVASALRFAWSWLTRQRWPQNRFQLSTR